jgi:hypothetical protein
LPLLEELIRRRWPMLAAERVARVACALRDGQLVELRGGDPSGRGAWVHAKEYAGARPPRHALTARDLDERVTAYPDRNEGPVLVYRNPAFEMNTALRAQAEAVARASERVTRATTREE